MSQQAKPFSTTAKLVHWGFLVVFIYALTKQIDEVEELEDAVLLQSEMIFASIFLILLHIAGAIYHRREKDGVWNAMVPFWNENPPTKH